MLNFSFLVTRFSKSKNIWILLKLYKIYVRPKLEFSTPIWSPFLKNDITKIQKRFIKFACQKCNIPFSSYSDRLTKLNLESFEYRCRINDLTFLYKTIHDCLD